MQDLIVSPESAVRRMEGISLALRRAARKSRVPQSFSSGGGGFRARRSDRLYRFALVASFGLMVLVPLVVASIYFGLVASPQYATEFKFALRSSDHGVLDSLTGLGGFGGSQQSQDAQIVANYVRSRGMIEALKTEPDVRAIFTRPDVDRFSRLEADAPIEELEKYWRRRVDATLDETSGIVSVSVRAFTAEDSLRLAEAIVAKSEGLVNDMSMRLRRDALERATAELRRAEANLRDATAAMRDVRTREGVLDTGAAAKGLQAVIDQLRTELSGKEQQLSLQGGATDDAPQVRLLKAQIAELRRQIADYVGKLAGAQGGDPSLATRQFTLGRAETDARIAQEQYAAAARAYEMARTDVETQKAYLVTFLKPMAAEQSLYPRRWLYWSATVGPAFLVWVLFVSLMALSRDHMSR